MDHQRQAHEVDTNYAVFADQLERLLLVHRDEYVLMRNGAMVSFHPDAGSALSAGRAAYPDGIYSVQEVTDIPADLGFFSHAVVTRIA